MILLDELPRLVEQREQAGLAGDRTRDVYGDMPAVVGRDGDRHAHGSPATLVPTAYNAVFKAMAVGPELAPQAERRAEDHDDG